MIDDGGDTRRQAEPVPGSSDGLRPGRAGQLPKGRPIGRTIDGFHQDDTGDWVAELSCFHNQHVRHRPPFQTHSWVLSAEGRAARVGTVLDCPLCGRAEPPDGLSVVRTAGPFDAATVPAGLLTEHVVADRTWGRLQVIDGALVFSIQTEPPFTIRLREGDRQAIPPGVPHSLALDGPVRFTVDFLTVVPRRRGNN
jgi:tellurite resistance-related uncharacterized protein